MRRSLSDLKQCMSDNKYDIFDDPKLRNLVTENTKLKHRLAVLQRVSIFCKLFNLFINTPIDTQN